MCFVLPFQTLSSGAEDTSVVDGEPERRDGSGTPLSSFAGGAAEEAVALKAGEHSHAGCLSLAGHRARLKLS